MPRAITRKPDGQAPLRRFTPELKRKFLEKLVLCGRIAESAWAIGASYRTVEEHRKKDAVFAEAFEEAMARYRDRIEKAVHDRAIDGVKEPVVYQGQIMKGEDGKPLTVTKYDNKLLLAHAARHIPEYREKVDVSATVKAGVLVVGAALSQEEWVEQFGEARLPERPPSRTPGV